MVERVFILRGQILIGNLAFQLTRRDNGLIEVFDFKGYGFCDGNALNLLRYGDYGPVSAYVIATAPTPESADYAAGIEFAEKQKARRRPSVGKSVEFYAGWRDGWIKRRGTQ